MNESHTHLNETRLDINKPSMNESHIYERVTHLNETRLDIHKTYTYIHIYICTHDSGIGRADCGQHTPTSHGTYMNESYISTKHVYIYTKHIHVCICIYIYTYIHITAGSGELIVGNICRRVLFIIRDEYATLVQGIFESCPTCTWFMSHIYNRYVPDTYADECYSLFAMSMPL